MKKGKEEKKKKKGKDLMNIRKGINWIRLLF